MSGKPALHVDNGNPKHGRENTTRHAACSDSLVLDGRFLRRGHLPHQVQTHVYSSQQRASWQVSSNTHRIRKMMHQQWSAEPGMGAANKRPRMPNDTRRSITLTATHP
jgi:hypothetical protein